MTSSSHVTLVALCVAPLLCLCLSTQAEARRLESLPFEASISSSNNNHHQRVRRNVFQVPGMPCVTVSFLTELKGRFRDRIDPNDDGKATAEEVRQYLSHFNPRVTDQQVTTFITRRDLDGNGIIEFVPEYVLDISTPDMTSEAASEWFSLEDADADGYVTRQELTNIAQRLGMTSEQADVNVSSYYMAVDSNNDDKLDFDEYKTLYQN